MLNKLLKRCMPWMDKGRWYKISAVTHGDMITVKYDSSLIDNVTKVSYDNYTLYKFHLNGIYSIIDIKGVISSNTDPTYTRSIMMDELGSLLDNPDNNIEIPAYHASDNAYEIGVDYWIFARRL